MIIEDIAMHPEQLKLHEGAIDILFENPKKCDSGSGKVFVEGDLAIFADGKIYAPGQISAKEIIQSTAYPVRIHYNGRK